MPKSTKKKKVKKEKVSRKKKIKEISKEKLKKFEKELKEKKTKLIGKPKGEIQGVQEEPMLNLEKFLRNAKAPVLERVASVEETIDLPEVFSPENQEKDKGIKYETKSIDYSPDTKTKTIPIEDSSSIDHSHISEMPQRSSENFHRPQQVSEETILPKQEFRDAMWANRTNTEINERELYLGVNTPDTKDNKKYTETRS